ncbi:metallothionein-like protein type 3 [Nymphaea colorata]|nr:metallothionein-like protein type 3 [Nymphaea colorata]
MSTCGNCDCADKSQCVKKGNSFGIDIIETEKSYFDEVMEVPAAENGCKCGAGSACKCVNCSCGAH